MPRITLKKKHNRTRGSAANVDELTKFLDHCINTNQLISEATQIYLWVIDMQPDFIDEQFNDETVFTKEEIPKIEKMPYFDINIPGKQTLKIRIGGENGIKKVEQRPNKVWRELESANIPSLIEKGRFAVDEGKRCIEDIGHYITLLESGEHKHKLQKVIFSRDLHTSNNPNIEDPNHCSFSVNGSTKGKIDGIGFPTHCVNGTTGCQLHDKIWNMVTDLGKKSMVVIKGCQHDVDSFGAVSYSCKNHPHTKMYTNSRQHNGCNTKCSENNDLPGTGSYVLENPTGAEDKRNNKLIDLVNVKTDKNKVENVLDLQDSERGVLHLVCGLAGDYCVRDTAINLKFKYPNHKVAVIADATRYPSLPDSVIDVTTNDENRESIHNNFKNNLHLNSHTDTPSQLNNFFLTAPDTLLYTYSPAFFNPEKQEEKEGVLFTMDPNRKTNIKYTKPQGDDRPVRDPTNNYWCLSRHMYLLGKQLLKCDEDSNIYCYKKQKLGVRKGTGFSVLGLTTRKKSRMSNRSKGRKTRKRTRQRRREKNSKKR